MPSQCSGCTARWFHTRYECSRLRTVSVKCPVASALVLNAFYGTRDAAINLQVYCSVTFVTVTYAIIRRHPTCSSCRASYSAPRGFTQNLPQVTFSSVFGLLSVRMPTCPHIQWIDICTFVL
jgi:hypothetical protein